MNLGYLVLLLTLKNIKCFNPKRHAQTSTSNFKNLKSKASEAVIPARYKITSTSNYENPSTTLSFPEFFPEVEYPESVVESSKPFYISSSPFPNDVKSTFNSLVAKEKNKAKTVTDYSWTQYEKIEEKVPVPSQKVDENEITVTKGNGINTINETVVKDIKEEDKEDGTANDDTANDEIPHSDNEMDRLCTNWTSLEQSDESKETNYVVGLLNNLTEVMKNLTNIETLIIEEDRKVIENLTNAETPDCDEGNLSTEAFESESDIIKMTPDLTPNNNDTITELNGNSDLTDEHPEPIRNPLFEDSDTNDTLTMFASLFNDYITNATSVEDMQSDVCSIGTVANETDISCTKS